MGPGAGAGRRAVKLEITPAEQLANRRPSDFPRTVGPAFLAYASSRDYPALRVDPRIRTKSQSDPIDDRPVANPGATPPRLPGLRNRIHLQSFRGLLVRGRNRAPADAGRRRRLPVPGLFAQGGGTGGRESAAL